LTAQTPFGYAGAYTDPDGLLYLVNRYYNPATGQFLSVDPDVATSGQPYGYAGGNPVDNTDPTGLLFMGAAGQTYAIPYVPTYNYGFYIQDLPRTPAQKRTPPKTKKAVRKATTRKATAAKPVPTCSVADERFGLDPGCRPETLPKSSGRVPTWLLIGAAVVLTPSTSSKPVPTPSPTAWKQPTSPP
jgi:RHS repeat-associated protein